MESKTYFRNIRISPKKIRFMLYATKSLKPTDAVTYLYNSRGKSARILYKLVNSALAAAKQTLKVDEHLLKFKVLAVDGGSKIKRYKAGPKGTANPIERKFVHVQIVLETEEPEKKEVNKKVVAKQEEPKKVKRALPVKADKK